MKRFVHNTSCDFSQDVLYFDYNVSETRSLSMLKIKNILRNETVLFISLLAALFTALFVRPSIQYFSYIDFKVLVILFCLMAIVSGLKKIGVFGFLAQRMTAGSKKSKALRLSLILICFFSSMLITNDVALITFVPFAIIVLNITAQTNHMIYVIVMQTIAANLGSMLTPVGNPQNLYLYSFYNMQFAEFFKITIPITIAGLLIILLFSVIGKNENINVRFNGDETITNNKLLILYLFLFVLCLGTVFHFIDYKVTFLIVSTAVFLTDKSLFKNIDYGLLATFVCFFIFVGNLGNIQSVNIFISNIIEDKELIISVLLSQIFSNVPTSVLLSNFSGNYKALVIGTNIGGLGTLIASLASLISFKLYIKTNDCKPFKYILVFSIVNILILLMLFAFSKILI